MNSNLPWGAKRALLNLEREESDAEYVSSIALTIAENISAEDLIDRLPPDLADKCWAVLRDEAAERMKEMREADESEKRAERKLLAEWYWE